MHLGTGLIDLDLDPRSQESEKAKTSAPIISETDTVLNDLKGIYCWDLLIWWTSYSFYVVHSILKGENPTYVNSLKKRLACIQTFTDHFLGMMLNVTKLYSLIPPWMTLMFRQGHKVMRSKSLCSHTIVELYEATQMFMVVNHVREMTVHMWRSLVCLMIWIIWAFAPLVWCHFCVCGLFSPFFV